MSILIFTDGSSMGLKDDTSLFAGGWAALLVQTRDDEEGILLQGSEKNTTNNRMELTAILNGLEQAFGMYPGQAVTICTDSEYCIDTITKKKQAHVNKDLIEAIQIFIQGKPVKFQWLKGHNGDPLHDLVDKYARQNAQALWESLE
jgi:ribonuclease HI